MPSPVAFNKAALAQRFPAGVGSRFFAAADEGATYFDTGFEWWKIAGPDYALITAQEYIAPFSFITRDGKQANDASVILGFSVNGAVPGAQARVYFNGVFDNPAWQWVAGQPLYLNGTEISANGTRRIGTAASYQTVRISFEEAITNNIVETKSPDVAPDAVGQLWVDSTARRAWVAVGVASAADWLEINTPTTAKLYNSTTATIQPIELQGVEAAAAIVIGPS